ncbi:MAG: hypothetical protein M0Z39_04820 [Actinomycetota bacterium]|jgi:hypothetical protein|nr:hypothetical protein [Actinomycetota bacterium]
MKRPVWLDQLLASDPALTHLVSAVATTVSMGLCFLVEWQFVNITGALGTSGYQSAKDMASASALHNEVVIVAMLVSKVFALMLSLSIDESDFRGTAIATIVPTVPLLGAMVIALALGSHKWIALSINPLLLGIGTLFRRYVSSESGVGTMLYMGGFFGYFLSSQFGIKAFGWLALEVLVAVVVIFAFVRVPLLFYERKSNLERAVQSYTIRARLLTRLAVAVLLSNRRGNSRKLRNALVRLNEMALIIEAYMSKTVASSATEEMRQTLFDLELSLSNLARFSDTLPRVSPPSIATKDIIGYILQIPEIEAERLATEPRESLARAQSFAVSSDTVTPILLRRLTTSIVNLNLPATRWQEVQNTLASLERGPSNTMRHVASLRTGHLPGSADVSGADSSEPWESSRRSMIDLTPEVRAACQVTVATATATWIGYLLVPQRFYWASLSALLCFMGVKNAVQQVRKGLYRFLGSVIGVAIGFTIAISKVFLQLSELTTGLLLELVLATTVGALIASLTALFVLPLGPQRVIATARAKFLENLQQLLTAVAKYLGEPPSEDVLVG